MREHCPHAKIRVTSSQAAGVMNDGAASLFAVAERALAGLPRGILGGIARCTTSVPLSLTQAAAAAMASNAGLKERHG